MATLVHTCIPNIRFIGGCAGTLRSISSSTLAVLSRAACGYVYKDLDQSTNCGKGHRPMNQLLIAEIVWMIVDKIWKLTNVGRVGLAPRSSHSQKQPTFPKMCVPIEKFRFVLRKRAPGTTVEGLKAKKVRTTSDDAGAKSVTEKSKSTGGKCVSQKISKI